MWQPWSCKIPLCLIVMACLTTTRIILAFPLTGGSYSPLPPLAVVREEGGPTTNRREVLKQVSTAMVFPWSLLLVGGCPMGSSATTIDMNDPVTSPAPPPPPVEVVVVLRGRVTLPTDAGIWNDILMTTTTAAAAALYVTCRPNRPDNVPAAILNGSRGKPPPVLSARIPLSSSSSMLPSSSSTTTTTTNPMNWFPLDFELTIPRDLTVEGAWDGTMPLSTTSTMEDGSANVRPPYVPPTTLDELWWKRDELILSVRLDTDGVSATRNPDDLVGRAVCTADSTKVVDIQLTGRGVFGKFATSRK